MSDTDAHRILVPVGDSDTLRDTVSYAVEQASAAAPNRPVELHFVVAAQTQSVNPDAPQELGSAREQLERVALWIEEDTGTESDGTDGLSDGMTVVTEIVGTDRYLFSPGDFADGLLQYAAETGIDQIVVDPEYNPAGTASMLRPMSVELGRGDVPVETAPSDRPTQGAALARAASLSKYLSVFVVSYLFYMLLSAWKPFDFLTGFVTAAIVSAVLAPVVANRSAPLGLTLRRLARLVVYAPYLVKEIAVANLQVAYVVLHPDMPIDPEVVQLRAAVWGDGAVTTLANSITLTPGTLTVNVSERSFDIHSLTADSREDLFDGGLERAVRFVFYGRAAARIPTPRERGDAGEGRDG